MHRCHTCKAITRLSLCNLPYGSVKLGIELHERLTYRAMHESPELVLISLYFAIVNDLYLLSS